MTGYKRGTVVLLPFPFSDQSSAKIRPAVVVSPDYPSHDLVRKQLGQLREADLAKLNAALCVWFGL